MRFDSWISKFQIFACPFDNLAPESHHMLFKIAHEAYPLGLEWHPQSKQTISLTSQDLSHERLPSYEQHLCNHEIQHYGTRGHCLSPCGQCPKTALVMRICKLCAPLFRYFSRRKAEHLSFLHAFTIHHEIIMNWGCVVFMGKTLTGCYMKVGWFGCNGVYLQKTPLFMQPCILWCVCLWKMYSLRIPSTFNNPRPLGDTILVQQSRLMGERFHFLAVFSIQHIWACCGPACMRLSIWWTFFFRKHAQFAYSRARSITLTGISNGQLSFACATSWLERIFIWPQASAVVEDAKLAGQQPSLRDLLIEVRQTISMHYLVCQRDDMMLTIPGIPGDVFNENLLVTPACGTWSS